MQPESIAFSPFDRVWLDSPSEPPWTVHVEVELPRPVRSTSLRSAARATIRRHPFLSARPDRASGSWLLGPPVEPETRITDVAAGDLSRWRSEAVSEGLDLERSAVRFHLVPGNRRSRILVVADHAVVDGIAVQHLASTLVGALVDPGSEPGPVDVTWRAGHALDHAPARPDHVEGVVDRMRGVARRKPVRLATSTDRPGHGYGVAYRSLRPETVRALSGRALGAPANDVVVAAVALAIMAHNRHRRQPTLPMTIGVPVNLRPPRSWDRGVCNAATNWPIHIGSDDPAEVLRAVSTQRRPVRAGLLSSDVRALLTHLAPRAALPHWARHVALSMTTVVSSVPTPAWVWPVGLGPSDRLTVWGGSPAPPTQGMTFVAMLGPADIGLSSRYLNAHHTRSGAEELLSSIEDMIGGLVEASSAAT